MTAMQVAQCGQAIRPTPVSRSQHAQFSNKTRGTQDRVVRMVGDRNGVVLLAMVVLLPDPTGIRMVGRKVYPARVTPAASRVAAVVKAAGSADNEPLPEFGRAPLNASV